jgi:hypothetical protein
MAKYLFTYHGGDSPQPETDEEAVMAEWMAWFGTLGSAVVDPGNPTGPARTVNPDGSSADGGGANPITGYSLISAESLAAAADIAKGCPHLKAGGTIQVAETIDM